MTTTNTTLNLNTNLENLISNVETIFYKYRGNFRQNMCYSAAYCVELNKPLSSLHTDTDNINSPNIKQNNNLEEYAEFIYRLINDLNDYNPQKVFCIFTNMEDYLTSSRPREEVRAPLSPTPVPRCTGSDEKPLNTIILPQKTIRHYKRVQNLYRILFMFNEGIDQMKWPGPTQTEFDPDNIPSYTEADIDEVNNELYRLLNLENNPTEPFLLYHYEIEMVQKLKQKINEYNNLCLSENNKLQIIKTYWEPVCFYDDTDCDVDGYESGFDSIS